MIKGDRLLSWNIPLVSLVMCCVLSPHTEQGNDMHNLNLAFEVAEKHLDIPKMLDAEGNIYRQK